MLYILTIDTAINSASICLSNNGELVAIHSNESMKDQASWIQPAIKNLLSSAGVHLHELKAIAVSIGPGSYTGLRIGLATAKGLCYSLAIPLIAIGTLDMMAMSAKDQVADLLCPMIDARRLEVFTAIYTKEMETVLVPCAMILDEMSFIDLLNKHTILFFGNGSIKFKALISHSNALFSEIETNAVHLIKMAKTRFDAGEFNRVEDAEPMYVKSFQTR